VLCILGYDDLDQAVEIGNDTEYGLAGYVSGADLDAARAVARRIRAGSVAINHGFDMNAPFGGYKRAATAASGAVRVRRLPGDQGRARLRRDVANLWRECAAICKSADFAQGCTLAANCYQPPRKSRPLEQVLCGTSVIRPPSTTNSAPVENDDSSLVRNTMNVATSSDVPAAQWRGHHVVGKCLVIGVRMNPGCTELIEC
jgi:hypothetical protein